MSAHDPRLEKLRQMVRTKHASLNVTSGLATTDYARAARDELEQMLRWIDQVERTVPPLEVPATGGAMPGLEDLLRTLENSYRDAPPPLWQRAARALLPWLVRLLVCGVGCFLLWHGTEGGGSFWWAIAGLILIFMAYPSE